MRRVDLYDQVHPVVVGVTSFGTPCTNGSTGVYTKISSYIDWIEEETKENFTYQNCINKPGYRNLANNLLEPLYIPAYGHLLQNSSLGSEYDCAGTLIDDRYVLTSAYCVTQPNETPKFVFFNVNNEAVQIDEVIVHPRYELGNPTNDIALLKLSMYLKPNSTLRPICLENTDTIHYPTYSFVFRSAFQSNLGNLRYSYHTKGVRRSIENCDDNVEESQICANNWLPILPGICQIDAGGPILSERIPQTTIPYLEGIAGIQSEGCGGKLLGTKIVPHIKWIESVILKMQLDDVLIFTS